MFTFREAFENALVSVVSVFLESLERVTAGRKTIGDYFRVHIASSKHEGACLGRVPTPSCLEEAI